MALPKKVNKTITGLRKGELSSLGAETQIHTDNRETRGETDRTRDWNLETDNFFLQTEIILIPLMHLHKTFPAKLGWKNQQKICNNTAL